MIPRYRDPNAGKPPLPPETRVLNINDGEPGRIRAALRYDGSIGEWVEYEVATDYGIERWQRRDFILFSEFESEI